MAKRVQAPDRIAGLVLAAGQSTRMGRNKLLCSLKGAPLIAHAVDAALDAQLKPVVVVTGHQAAAVGDALRDRAVRFADNPRFASGMASSLAAGLRELMHYAPHTRAALVMLGDMPHVRAAHLARMIAAFEQAEADAICVPEHEGRRGNPVLWPARDFAALASLTGDVGGRALLQAHAARVQRVAMADDGVLIDVDAPDLLAALTADPADEVGVESRA